MLKLIKLKEIRKENRYSCSAIASQLGMTTTQYWMIENGKCRIFAEQLEQLSQIYKVSVDTFFEDESPEKAGDSK